MSILQNIGQGIGQYLPFTVTIALFGIIFTALNRRIERVEKEKVHQDVCHQAQQKIEATIKGATDTMQAEIVGLKDTVCAKIDGLNGKIDVLINGED